MAAEDINYNNSIESILLGIAKGLGVEFKETRQDHKEKGSFRERMKERQRKNKENKNNG